MRKKGAQLQVCCNKDHPPWRKQIRCGVWGGGGWVGGGKPGVTKMFARCMSHDRGGLGARVLRGVQCRAAHPRHLMRQRNTSDPPPPPPTPSHPHSLRLTIYGGMDTRRRDKHWRSTASSTHTSATRKPLKHPFELNSLGIETLHPQQIFAAGILSSAPQCQRYRQGGGAPAGNRTRPSA